MPGCAHGYADNSQHFAPVESSGQFYIVDEITDDPLATAVALVHDLTFGFALPSQTIIVIHVVKRTTGAALLDVHTILVLRELRNYVQILFCHSLYVLLCPLFRQFNRRPSSPCLAFLPQAFPCPVRHHIT